MPVKSREILESGVGRGIGLAAKMRDNRPLTRDYRTTFLNAVIFRLGQARPDRGSRPRPAPHRGFRRNAPEAVAFDGGAAHGNDARRRAALSAHPPASGVRGEQRKALLADAARAAA